MKKEYFEGPFGEGFTKAVHSSGLEIYIMEKPQFSSSFAIFGTKYGSVDTEFSLNGGETVKVPEGIAHFLEHKLFESEDGDAFTKYAETGASANAFTSFDRTCYLFACSDRFYDNLAILLDFVQSPYFTAQTVSKEQGIIGQEIRMYDDSPDWRVTFNMLGAMYKNHPVKIDIAGKVESIAQIDDKLLYSCYNTFYNLSNMFICIAGNVNTEKVLAQINGALKPSEPVEITRIGCDEPDTVRENFVSQKMAVAYPMFCLGFKEPVSAPERTVKEKVATALLLEIIAGDASPLYKRLINAGLINDEFGFEYFTGHGYAAVMFEGESSDPEKVAAEIKTEIERIKIDGIDKKLFSAVRCGMYGDAVRSFNSVESITMNLVNCAMFDCGLFDELKYLKNITDKDVLQRLQLLDADRSVLSVIEPTEEQR